MSEPFIPDTLLGSRIAKARYSRGWTASQLAQRIGVKTTSIENWEAERSSPRANRVNQLAGVLNVPLLWLIGGADSPPDIDIPVLDETEVRTDLAQVQDELDSEQ